MLSTILVFLDSHQYSSRYCQMEQLIWKLKATSHSKFMIDMNIFLHFATIRLQDVDQRYSFLRIDKGTTDAWIGTHSFQYAHNQFGFDLLFRNQWNGMRIEHYLGKWTQSLLCIVAYANFVCQSRLDADGMAETLNNWVVTWQSVRWMYVSLAQRLHSNPWPHNRCMRRSSSATKSSHRRSPGPK